MNVAPEKEHYLQRELYDLIKRDSSVFEFLETGGLDGIWYWDLENPINEWMSPRFWETLGFEPSEKYHLASEWQDLIYPEDLSLALDNFKKHCEDPGHAYDQNVRYRHRDGCTVWVRCRGMAIRDEDGKPLRLLGAHTDVTDLIQTKEELKVSNEYLKVFTQAISHDLKSPLTTISQFSFLLQECLGDSWGREAEEIYGYLNGATKRLTELVQDLHAYSTLELTSLNILRVELVDLVDLARQSLEAEVVNSGAKISVEVGSVQVLCCPNLLMKVFQSLIDNAIKYVGSDECPKIEIGVSEREDVWLLSVTDCGVGIRKKHLRKVFEPLFRACQDAAIEGSGLGLALCEKIIKLHGGEIWVESSRRVGSTFYFTLKKSLQF